MNAFPNPELVKQWRERIGRFDDAGTTIAEFCHTEGYSVASFYQWRRRLRQAASEPPGFDGLSGLVAQHFQADLFSGHLFVFFNRTRTYVKILAWDQDGLSLWSKRLESGTFEKITGRDDTNFEIDAAELIMMLRGVQIEGSRRRKRYSLDKQDAA